MKPTHPARNRLAHPSLSHLQFTKLYTKCVEIHFMAETLQKGNHITLSVFLSPLAMPTICIIPCESDSWNHTLTDWK